MARSQLEKPKFWLSYLMALRHLRHRCPVDPDRHDNLELVFITPEAPPLQPKNFTTHR